MLIERVFTIGGMLVVLCGALMVIGFVLLGALPLLVPFGVAGGLMVGFGGFFLYVGREARQDRKRLLALGRKDGPRTPEH